MVQLQSNTSRVASCLTLASSAAATLPTRQTLNKQSRFLVQRKAREGGGGKRGLCSTRFMSQAV